MIVKAFLGIGERVLKNEAVWGAKRAVNLSMSVPLGAGIKIETDICYSTGNPVAYSSGP